jgi:hypothetical protein
MSDQSPWAPKPGGEGEGPAVSSGNDTPTAVETAPSGETAEGAPPAGGATAARGTASAAFMPIIGIMLIWLTALAVGLVVYLQQDDSNPYASTSIGDNEDDLVAMALRERDLPEGLSLQFRNGFENTDWADLLISADPSLATDDEASTRKAKQLDSQERITNMFSVFGWTELASSKQGQALRLISQSTLYASPQAARDDTSRRCGLLGRDKDILREFAVPSLGEQATGFTVTSLDAEQGKTVDTVVCFRTGRIVHGVVQTSLDGAQDIGLVISLAERMESHVRLTYEGKAEPIDEAPAPGEG